MSNHDEKPKNNNPVSQSWLIAIIVALIGLAGAILGQPIINNIIGSDNEDNIRTQVALELTQTAIATFQTIQPTFTATPISPASGTYGPATAEDAAAMFGGPAADLWYECPNEPAGNCWTFHIIAQAFRVTVPENCLRSDGSIDGWRYLGGEPSQPEIIEDRIHIWETLEGASIRCRA